MSEQTQTATTAHFTVITTTQEIPYLYAFTWKCLTCGARGGRYDDNRLAGKDANFHVITAERDALRTLARELAAIARQFRESLYERKGIAPLTSAEELAICKHNKITFELDRLNVVKEQKSAG